MQQFMFVCVIVSLLYLHTLPRNLQTLIKQYGEYNMSICEILWCRS